MRAVVLGPPGSGKGTQAMKMSQHFDIPHISIGDLLRDHVSEDTKVGRKANRYLDQGLLVPDDLVIEMIKSRINAEDCTKGWILDGFPRNIHQAEKLEKFGKPDMVLNLFLENAELIRRLAGRRVCTKCHSVFNILSNPPEIEDVCNECGGELVQRDDDSEEVVRNRIEVYDEETRPLVKHYTHKGLLRSVYGVGSIDAVFDRILEALKH